jgi:Protein of unknown function (DUF3622)
MPKKFDITVVQTVAGEFTASVIRRRTSRGTTVERQRAGFTDRESAVTWAQSELANYLAIRERRKENQKKNRKERRVREALCEAWIEVQTLKSLAECIRGGGQYAISARHALQRKAEMLWEEIAFRALKRGDCEKHAYELANEIIGKKWKERFVKALAGDLDHADEAARDMAVANAVRLTLLGEAVVKDAEDG